MPLPILLALVVSQQQDTVRIAPVVVSATRLAVSTRTLPVAVTVIGGDQLRAKGITTVADALNDVTSAYIAQTGSQGGQASLFLRGGESKYVKVLIDGVPSNDPGGVFDFGSLTTDNIDRIEIVRGPVSVVHGADAVTGVVHIITRRGAGDQKVRFNSGLSGAPRTKVGAASPDATSAKFLSADIGGSSATASYGFGLAGHENDGLYANNNQFSTSVVSGNVAFTPLDGVIARLAVRYNASQFNYPTNSAGDVTDANAYSHQDRTAIGFEGERKLGSHLKFIGRYNFSLSDGGTDDAADTTGGDSFVSQDKIRRRSKEWRLEYQPNGRVTSTVGVQIENQDQRSQSQSQSSFGPFYSLFTAKRQNIGVYTEVLIALNSRVTLTAGIRDDDNEQFGRFRTGRAGASLWVAGSTRVRATIGNAFREPSFFENYATGFVAGNPNLNPERTRSVDGGVDQDLFGARLRLSITGFAQRFRDMIDYSGANACGFSYCNVAAAEASGAEVEVSGLIAGPLSGSLGGTWLGTRVMQPGFDATPGGLYRVGESLIRRPELKGTAELSYLGSGPLSGALRVLAVGDRPDRDFHFPAAPVTLPAYARVDVSGQYDVKSLGHAITFRIENALDAKYQNVFNFLAPRRTVMLGIRTSD